MRGAVAPAWAQGKSPPSRGLPSRPWGPLALRAGVGLWLGLLVALPVLALGLRGLQEGPSGVWEALTAPSAKDALLLSLWASGVAAVVNGLMGTALAFALVRWQFPGRRLISALVDLPLAIPTLVAGIVLVALFGPQTSLGKALSSHGGEVAFAQPGIVLALLFVTLPFVVRAVEPVLLELDPAEEEASRILGASDWTTLVRILLPPLWPAVAAGTVQVFARSVAEFGSIAAVSGNIPHQTLTAPVYVLGEVEGGNPGGAAAMSLVLLLLALGLQGTSQFLGRRAGGGRG